MSVIKAVLLGIIQGITEFLPISSSGHLSLIQGLTGTAGPDVIAMTTFLHLGTLFAIIFCFKKTIRSLFTEGIAMIKETVSTRSFAFWRFNMTRKTLVYFVVSCIPLLFLLLPAGGGDRVLDKTDVFTLDKSLIAEGICFIITGCLIITGSIRAKRNPGSEKMNFLYAAFVGVAQLFAACFPGISRSGSTISTGLICGIDGSYMIKYSFILSLPAVLVANIKEFASLSISETSLTALPVICGILAAAVTGIFATKLLVALLKKNLFKYCGFYCIAVGIICFVVNVIRAVTA